MCRICTSVTDATHAKLPRSTCIKWPHGLLCYDRGGIHTGASALYNAQLIWGYCCSSVAVEAI